MFAGSYRLAKRPIQQSASDLFGPDVSPGMTSEPERRAAEALEPIVAEVAAAVVAAPAAHIDETSWPEADEKAWLRVGQADDLIAFTIADDRGADVARSTLGTGKAKVVISNRFPGYDRIEQHQYCRSHLRGDFRAMIDRQDEGSAVGSDLLGASNRPSHRRPEYRDGAMAWRTFLGHARPIRRGVKRALGRGASCPGDETAATCRMLPGGEEHLRTSLRVHGIEPTNNGAERALRHAVSRRRSGGGTASERGGRFVERVLGVAATCRQRGRDVLGYRAACFRAHPVGVPWPSLVAGRAAINRGATQRMAIPQ